MKVAFITIGLAIALQIGCASVRTLRQVDQAIGPVLTTGIGGTIFRMNKSGDLPNVVGGRDIYGGKVDKGFAEMKLAGVEGQTVVLDIVDLNRQSSETTMDRYKPFQRNAAVNVEVQNTVSSGTDQSANPYRIALDTTKQRDIVISGIRVSFVEVQPYSIRYTLQDTQPQ